MIKLFLTFYASITSTSGSGHQQRVALNTASDHIVTSDRISIGVLCRDAVFSMMLWYDRAKVRPTINYTAYRVGQKKVSLRCLHITSSNTGQFSKLFHCHILQEICNIAIIKYPTSPQTCRYTTL